MTTNPLNFSFRGRSRRSEYLLRGLAWLAAGGVGQMLIMAIEESIPALGPPLMFGLLLFMLTDLLAVTARRLHDIGWSGATAVLLLVPFVNLLLIGMLMLIDSQEGPNKYGVAVKVFGEPAERGEPAEPTA